MYDTFLYPVNRNNGRYRIELQEYSGSVYMEEGDWDNGDSNNWLIVEMDFPDAFFPEDSVFVIDNYEDTVEYVTAGVNINIPNTVVKTTPQTLSNAAKKQALANLGIDLINYAKNAKIIIDFNKPGRHTFEEYGIDLATSNGLLLAAMVKYLAGGNEVESILVETINMPNYDSDYSNTQGPTYIGHTYTQYLEDSEKDIGYEIDVLNKTISIWV